MSLKTFTSSEKKLIRTLQGIGLLLGLVQPLFIGILWLEAFGRGLVYTIVFYWIGRGIVKIKKEKTIFYESEQVARIKQYIGLAFIVSALGSLFLWYKAWQLDFSTSYATCLTRSGQACLQTSNPVWTAATLKWLAPLFLIISILGLFIFALMRNTWITLIVAFLYIIGMSYLALSFEIKNKIGWTNASISQFSDFFIII